MVFPMKCIKTAQYHDATNDMLYLNFSKTAQYHDATNNMRHLIFSRYFPWKSPKRLSTMMLQIADFICNFHGISHEMHQNGSVPRCYKWHALSQFFHGISHEFRQNSSVPWCYKWHALSHFSMVCHMKFTKTAQYHDPTNDKGYLNFSW